MLLREGRAALDAVDAADRRTRRAALAATGGPGLVLATKAGASDELLAKLLDAYAAEPGAVAVDVRPVRDRRAGEAAARRAGRRGAAAPAVRLDGRVRHRGAVHRGAGRGPAGRAPPAAPGPQLRMAEVTALPDLPLPRWPGADGTYPDGPGPRGPRPDAAVPADRARPGLRGPAGVVPRASCAATSPPCPCSTRRRVTTVIAWPPHSRSRALAGLVRAATRL